MTDKQIIANSTIKTTKSKPEWIESGNLLNDFPNKEIDLTIQLRSSKDGVNVGLYASQIYINF